MFEKRLLMNQIVIMKALLSQTKDDQERVELVNAIRQTETMIKALVV